MRTINSIETHVGVAVSLFPEIEAERTFLHKNAAQSILLFFGVQYLIANVDA